MLAEHVLFNRLNYRLFAEPMDTLLSHNCNTHSSHFHWASKPYYNSHIHKKTDMSPLASLQFSYNRILM